jgi:hypothetical protein
MGPLTVEASVEQFEAAQSNVPSFCAGWKR